MALNVYKSCNYACSDMCKYKYDAFVVYQRRKSSTSFSGRKGMSGLNNFG